MAEKTIWLRYFGGEHILPGTQVVEALSCRGLRSFLDQDPSSGAGLLLFDRDTTELRESLRTYSHKGLERVLAIGVTRKMMTVETIWNLLQAGASDVLVWA